MSLPFHSEIDLFFLKKITYSLLVYCISDQSRALNRAATLKPVPDFKSYTSPVARLPNVSECTSSASNKASSSSLLFVAACSNSTDSTTPRMSSDDNSSSIELVKNTVADDTSKLKDVEEQEVADICRTQDKDDDKILDDLKSSISEIFMRSQRVSLDYVTTSSCPQQTTGSATMSLPSEPDDLWPFPFSQNPEEWDFDGKNISCCRNLLNTLDL